MSGPFTKLLPFQKAFRVIAFTATDFRWSSGTGKLTKLGVDHPRDWPEFIDLDEVEAIQSKRIWRRRWFA